MKYKCLILDHDDTAVKSTPELHYPSFVEIMEKMRPGHRMYTLEEFIYMCFDPGFEEYLRAELDFDDADMTREYNIWMDYIKDKTPHFYEGFLDIVKDFQKQGGYICVVSHSDKKEIIRHYKENNINLDLVYGWELSADKRKPHPYPVEQILSILKLEPKDCLMVDDLKPGYDMAKACNIDFVAAGWSHGLVPAITEFMKKNCDIYFETVEELRHYIFDEPK